MASRPLRHATTIHLIGDDLLQNIFARLPATSFASAACVSRSWNAVCDRVFSRPKIASACSSNLSLQDAVKEVVNKVLSEPIRPQFAIASIGGLHVYVCYRDGLEEAKPIITAALGTQVPVVYTHPHGIIGRDAISDELKEIEWCYGGECYHYAVSLIVGFLPGLKVTTIPLLTPIQEPEPIMIDEFVTGIREFSTSVSGCNSPSAIIMFVDYQPCVTAVMEKLDYAMSPETVIVGSTLSEFLCTNDPQYGISAAVALVFVVDRNKPPGIGETQFHVVSSSGFSPIGPTYRATSVIKDGYRSSWLAARRVGSHESIDGETILNQVYNEIGGRFNRSDLRIGVAKKRNCSIGQENVRCMTSLSYHGVGGDSGGHFKVSDGGIKTNDTFRFYHSDSTTALSSHAAVSNHLRSFNQGCNNTTGSAKREVFGGLIFTCPNDSFLCLGAPNVSSPFLDNFPSATLGGTFCNTVIGRRVLTLYVKETQEQKEGSCCEHVNCIAYLVMSYTP